MTGFAETEVGVRFIEPAIRTGRINPKIMFGKPVIKGTRISVEIILRKLSQNISIDKIIQDYPHLTRKDIQAALEYAAESVHGEEVHFVPVTLREEL